MLDQKTYRSPRDCSLREAQVLHGELTAALDTAQALEIDCGLVERADLAFVQLVVSAHRTAHRNAKALRVTNASPAVLSAFARAGFAGPDLPTPAA